MALLERRRASNPLVKALAALPSLATVPQGPTGIDCRGVQSRSLDVLPSMERSSQVSESEYSELSEASDLDDPGMLSIETDASVAAQPDDHPDKLYDIEKVLGWGSTAVVRKAVRKADGCTVALKQWQIEQEDHERRNFAREEYDIMRSLDHSSIVRAEDFHETAVAVWICMEFCDGGDADTYIRKHGPFTETIAQDLSLQLLLGVNYLHGKRVAHRDLKPQNLVLVEGCRMVLKITDFNSAKQIGCGPRASLMLSDRGTPQFSAPEVRFGGDWNERVDIWACGLCIFYFLHGRLPFDITRSGTASELRKGEMPSIQWSAEASQLLRNLVMQCLALDMRDRPSIMELLVHPIFVGSSSFPAGKFVSDSCADAGHCGLTYGDAKKLLRKPRKPRRARSLGDRCYRYRERRDGVEIFRRLANRRWERTMLTQQSELGRKETREGEKVLQDLTQEPMERAVLVCEDTGHSGGTDGRHAGRGTGIFGEYSETSMALSRAATATIPNQLRQRRPRNAFTVDKEKFFSISGAITDEDVADAFCVT